jgi:hypothetical protein
MILRLPKTVFVSLRQLLVLTILSSACVFASESETQLPITADNSICAFSSETKANLGASPRIKLKGIQNFILLNFDTAPLKGMVVKKAVLHIKATEKNVMVRKVGFSTVAVPWSEGKGTSDEKPGAPGDSCFETPETGSDKKWGGPGSNFLNAYGGRSGTIWMESFVKPANDEMWYDMEFDGRLLEACAAGLSHGICVTDDNGQCGNIAKEVINGGNFDNNYFFSREQSNAKPYFVVELGGPVPATDPLALAVTVKPWQSGANFKDGGVEVSWQESLNADQTLGYKITILSVNGEKVSIQVPRYQTPAPAKAQGTVRALLSGQKPDAEIEVNVYRIGRGGMVTGGGQAKGKVSPAFPQPAKLPLDNFNTALDAGAPPENDNGVVWAVPDCAKVNPISGNVFEESPDAYAKDPAGKWNQANPAWSGAKKSVSLHTLRGEWAAFQIVCQNKKDSGNWNIKPADLKGPDGATIPASALRMAQLWYQHAGEGKKKEKDKPKDDETWYPDPMVPLKSGESFQIPNAKNAVAGQKNETVYVDFYVPKDAKPGDYSGSIAVQAGDAEPITLTVNLNVCSAVIPDQAHFVWSMNAYTSPGGEWGKADSADFLSAEQSFYAVAHEHRTCLAVLHYGHGGNFQDGTKWPLTGAGKDTKVSSWDEWDKRFGPLFDGSAFKDTPRAGVPLDHFYLPLAEHYPTPMKAYKWNDSSWEDHWKVAGPIEEGFPQDYKDAWTAVARDFIEHVKAKGWKTKFQIYLNDKYYYKQYKAPKGAGHGVSFWLLDEPQHIDDYFALAFFAKLLRAAQNDDRSQVLFRADISRPQGARDVLDGLLDLFNGDLGEYTSWVEDWRDRYGQDIWTYGGAERNNASALAASARALDLYTSGVNGYVPWLTLGDASNWQKYADTCVVYSGKPFGITGACPSLRLKGYRRAEQDVEYLYLLAEKRGLLKDDPSRRQLKELCGSAIKASRTFGKLDAEGQGTVSFGDLKIEDFERLRKAIAAELK